MRMNVRWTVSTQVTPLLSSRAFPFLLLLLSSLCAVRGGAGGPLGLGPHSRHRQRRQQEADNAAQSTSSTDFHPILAGTSHLHASGLKLRVSPYGLQYLNQVAADLLAHELPRLLIPNIEHHLPNNQGLISISKVRMSRFKRARHHNITTGSPNRFIWDMQDMNIGLIGDLSGNTNIVVPLELTGEAEVLAEGLNFHLESMLEKSRSGSAAVRTIACTTSIASVQAIENSAVLKNEMAIPIEVINHNGGLFGLAVSVFKQGISDNVRVLLEKLICHEVKKYIDDDLNAKLAEDFGSDLFIDYRLRETPLCGENTIELRCTGEVSYRGLGGTPFGPVPIPSVEPDGEMLSFALSDFVVNSLFYHTFKQRRMRLVLDKNSKGVGHFLRTSCGETVCIGDLLPQLADTHPNASLALLFAASRAPAILFSERNGGLLSISINGVIILYVEEKNRKKQIALFDLESIAESALSVQNGKVHASIHLEKFELKKKYGQVAVSKAELDDIAILGSSLIENMLNEIFEKGFPLPVPSVARLEDVRLSVHSRRLVLRTKLNIDERRLFSIASNVLFPFITPSKDSSSAGLAALLDLKQAPSNSAHVAHASNITHTAITPTIPARKPSRSTVEQETPSIFVPSAQVRPVRRDVFALSRDAYSWQARTSPASRFVYLKQYWQK